MAGTKFHSRTSGLGGAVFRNATMKEVLAQSADGGAYADLGRYVVAALLNSAAGRTPFLSQTTVRQMWNDVVSKGSYEPTAGVRWGISEVTSYLKSTMR